MNSTINQSWPVSILPLSELGRRDLLFEATESKESFARYMARIPWDDMMAVHKELSPDSTTLEEIYFRSDEEIYRDDRNEFAEGLPYTYQQEAVYGIDHLKVDFYSFLYMLDELKIPRTAWEKFCRERRIDDIREWLHYSLGCCW